MYAHQCPYGRFRRINQNANRACHVPAEVKEVGMVAPSHVQAYSKEMAISAGKRNRVRYLSSSVAGMASRCLLLTDIIAKHARAKESIAPSSSNIPMSRLARRRRSRLAAREMYLSMVYQILKIK